MEQQHHRLPSIRDMVDMVQPRGTATQSHWTPVNHQQQQQPPSHPPPPRDAAAPLSPVPQSANLHLHPSLPPFSPFRHDHPETPSRTQETLSLPASTDVGRASFLSAARSPSSPGPHHPAGKPITPERQDSFLIPSAPCETAIALPTPVHLGNSPESRHRSVLRDPLAHPLTPPSDSYSNQTHPSRDSNLRPYDKYRESTATTSTQETADAPIPPRHRSHSDATRPTMANLPQTAFFGNEKANMPPPPVPAPSVASPSQLTLEDIPPSSLNSGPLPTAWNHPSNAVNVDKESQEKCAYCNAIWTYPPMDTKSITPTGGPTTTVDDMQKNMDRLHAFTNEYNTKKNADYERWKQLHSGGHCHGTDPQSGNKRHFEEVADNDSPPAKSRKRSSESPPRRSRLTPPPEQGEARPGPFIYRSQTGTSVEVSHNTAILTGIIGAPRARPYVLPANDSSNMWRDNKRIKREETAQ